MRILHLIKCSIGKRFSTEFPVKICYAALLIVDFIMQYAF